MTTSEIVFYNSSWLIPVFKLSVELKILADSYRPFEMDQPLSLWKNMVVVTTGFPSFLDGCLTPETCQPWQSPSGHILPLTFRDQRKAIQGNQ